MTATGEEGAAVGTGDIDAATTDGEEPGLAWPGSLPPAVIRLRRPQPPQSRAATATQAPSAISSGFELFLAGTIGAVWCSACVRASQGSCGVEDVTATVCASPKATFTPRSS
ncbi:hypothetical protein [Catellatospora sp. NPDC049609]|uniref:hypothetical protein n=1 Tax=Catellatospora sp. NPDC049609 TaxID=3155505 RepID=UPI003448C0EA